ncbi:hypothetical protein MTZ49_10605 [Entomomonas sp. E2T0]|uniref:hypothetical protein n=1 Tax=Entomomonas sp. E2T0 TaxID=2930213 RepID=UPI002228153D|nr:hypothetical protein [Entomomonas sp. E2T0]UYZ83052.1 hypothetical protein MTZ49_10605 [Entomomonas sp. E2T0]
MRITSADIEAIILLLKRLLTGLWIGSKYIAVGNVGSANISAETKVVDVKKSSAQKRRLRQLPPLVIEDDVYEIPAIKRLRKVDLDVWEAENVKPRALDLIIKEHFKQLTEKGMKPSSVYFDV